MRIAAYIIYCLVEAATAEEKGRIPAGPLQPSKDRGAGLATETDLLARLPEGLKGRMRDSMHNIAAFVRCNVPTYPRNSMGAGAAAASGADSEEEEDGDGITGKEKDMCHEAMMCLWAVSNLTRVRTLSLYTMTVKAYLCTKIHCYNSAMLVDCTWQSESAAAAAAVCYTADDGKCSLLVQVDGERFLARLVASAVAYDRHVAQRVFFNRNTRPGISYRCAWLCPHACI